MTTTIEYTGLENHVSKNLLKANQEGYLSIEQLALDTGLKAAAIEAVKTRISDKIKGMEDHTTTDPQELVNKVMFYAYNFEYQFYLHIQWSANTHHMQNKWYDACRRENGHTHAGFIRFYTYLDGGNRKLLTEYINRTYKG